MSAETKKEESSPPTPQTAGPPRLQVMPGDLLLRARKVAEAEPERRVFASANEALRAPEKPKVRYEVDAMHFANPQDPVAVAERRELLVAVHEHLTRMLSGS